MEKRNRQQKEMSSRGCEIMGCPCLKDGLCTYEDDKCLYHISDADTSNQTPSVAQNQTWYNPDTRETKLFDGKKWIKIRHR